MATNIFLEAEAIATPFEYGGKEFFDAPVRDAPEQGYPSGQRLVIAKAGELHPEESFYQAYQPPTTREEAAEKLISWAREKAELE